MGLGRKGLKIDQKAIEKVHKNLAGTDFDFENEFDDDFGASPKQEMKSLKGFREQTKKAPIYMKDNEADQDQIPPVLFEEEFALEEKVTGKLTSIKSKGRPKRVVESEPSDNMDAGDSKEFPKFKIKLPKKSEDDVEEILEKVEKPKPKIPTLKIKIGRNDSPASIDEEEVESKASKKRRSSVDKSVEESNSQHQRIPKLKIKFGGMKEPDPVRDDGERGEFEEPPPLVIRSGTTPTSSPRNKQRTPTHNSKPGTPASDKFSTSELALESLKSDIAKSSPRSSLASTSHTAGRGTVGDSSSDLHKIFGSGEPLPVSVMADSDQPEAETEKSEDGPSELELLALELSNQLAKDKQRKAAEEAAKKETGSTVHHHDPKYKFKQLKQPKSEGEAPNPPTPVKNNLSQNCAASAGDSNPLRRMRKKELLSQYYGIELPPQPPQVPQAPPVSLPASNGPLMEPPPPPTSHSTNSSSNNRMVIGIKMPKAVASVTSVPTRADYQQQLEANLERKRKREGKEDYKKGKGSKSGKGGKKNVWEEPYKPKIKMNPEDAEAEGDTSKDVRRTRGKPPKKCLAVDDSPERDPVESFIENKKNESLRYAEEVLATFDQDEDKSERRRRDKKKRRRDAEDDFSQPNSKTPRIVIKFSKNKDPPSNKNNPDNGLIKPPVGKDSISSEGPSLKLPKLKIKNLIEPSTT